MLGRYVMTDLRTRLAETLSEKWPVLIEASAAKRIADHLLFLPDIAIVELPEGVGKDVVQSLVDTAGFFAHEIDRS